MAKASKPIKVVNAEITDDGAIIVEFNQAVAFPGCRKIIYFPEVLEIAAEKFAKIPPKEGNDFPGIPVVTPEDAFETENEDEEGEDE